MEYNTDPRFISKLVAKLSRFKLHANDLMEQKQPNYMVVTKNGKKYKEHILNLG